MYSKLKSKIIYLIYDLKRLYELQNTTSISEDILIIEKIINNVYSMMDTFIFKNRYQSAMIVTFFRMGGAYGQSR